MKTCGRCKTLKPSSDYNRDRSSKDGLQGRCRECQNAYSRARGYVAPGEVLPPRVGDPDNAHARAVAASIARHRERFNAYQREYWSRPENRARRKAKQARDAAWVKAKRRDARLNAEERAALEPIRQAERMRRWLEAHPERAKELGRRGAMRRYALAKGAAGYASPEDIRQRWLYYGGRCWICGGKATQTDHVIALNRGGSEWPANQRPACARCNRAKSDRDHREFLAAAV